jgi:hypothetical protein
LYIVINYRCKINQLTDGTADHYMGPTFRRVASNDTAITRVLCPLCPCSNVLCVCVCVCVCVLWGSLHAPSPTLLITIKQPDTWVYYRRSWRQLDGPRVDLYGSLGVMLSSGWPNTNTSFCFLWQNRHHHLHRPTEPDGRRTIITWSKSEKGLRVFQIRFLLFCVTHWVTYSFISDTDCSKANCTADNRFHKQPVIIFL